MRRPFLAMTAKAFSRKGGGFFSLGPVKNPALGSDRGGRARQQIGDGRDGGQVFQRLRRAGVSLLLGGLVPTAGLVQVLVQSAPAVFVAGSQVELALGLALGGALLEPFHRRDFV